MFFFLIQLAKDGEYWRLLTPGFYELIASKDEYRSQNKIISIDHTVDRKEIEQTKRYPLEADIFDFVLERPIDELDNNIGLDDYIKY